eukprot:354744-Chlamydomonas_euryale.AAC.1
MPQRPLHLCVQELRVQLVALLLERRSVVALYIVRHLDGLQLHDFLRRRHVAPGADGQVCGRRARVWLGIGGREANGVEALIPRLQNVACWRKGAVREP